MAPLLDCAKRPLHMMFPLRRVRVAALPVALLLGGTVACNDLSGLTGKQQLPSGTPDPSTYRTPAGALALYQATLAAFQFSYGTGSASVGSSNTSTANGAFVDFMLASGLLTDELQPEYLGCPTCGITDVKYVDARQLGQGISLTNNLYTELQSIRNGATEGIGALVAYDSSASPALRGHLYALSGYAELLLADLYCSGVPLSTIDFKGDYTYATGSTTAQIYHDAIAKFDTALALSSDSTRIVNLARVGKGRAYLALGQYDSAAAAVASVPDGFAYQFPVDWTGTQYGQTNLLNDLQVSESNREGINGLPFLSDPRSAAQFIGASGGSQYMPVKYGGATPGILPITVADWLEARLIQAEAALNAGDVTTWLTTLNKLRTNGVPGAADTVKVAADTIVDTLGYTGCTAVGACDPNGFQTSVNYTSLVLLSSTTIDLSALDVPGGVVDTCRANNPDRTFACTNPQVNVYGTNFVPVVPLQIDTIWQAGTGGVSGLAPLTDPGTAAARVSLLFNERAYWLFLTGHRQGDLRRLVRQYHRSADQVYPTGPYPVLQLGTYGNDVTAPIPQGAESPDPLFHGCLSRGA